MADRYGYAFIKTELDEDGILLVTLNRPEVGNAVNMQMHAELRDLYVAIARDSEVKVVVLTGAGDAFCRGATVETLRSNLESAEAEVPEAEKEEPVEVIFEGYLGEANDITRNILAVRQPMIAAMNGDAWGGGASWGLFCDVTFMAEHAKICDLHVALGLAAADGGAILWPLLMGINRAKEYLMTGDAMTGPEAERLGLVNHCVPGDEVLPQAYALARRLARGATSAIRFNKMLVNKTLEQRFVQMSDLGFAVEGIGAGTREHKVALQNIEEYFERIEKS
jgi:enoyl-CoA hydratase